MSEISPLLDELISSSIQKYSQTGVKVHDYRISLADLGRQRVTEQLRNEVARAVDDVDLDHRFEESNSSFRVQVNLASCVMTVSQIRSMGVAMEHRQAEDW